MKQYLEQSCNLIEDLMGIIEEDLGYYFSSEKIAECNDFLKKMDEEILK